MKRIHDKLGTAGLIVAVVALVAALGGSAIAANTATDSGKRNKRGNAGAALAKKYSKAFSLRFSKAFSKRFAVPGPAGPQGPAGADGQNGSNGSNGADGADGEQGPKGDTGANGESVAVSAYEGPECEGASGEAGAKFTNKSGTAYACNGADGEGGGGGTQTGTWSASGNPAAEFFDVGPSMFEEEPVQFVPVSFGAPVTPAPTFVFVPQDGEGNVGTAAGCPGLDEDGVPQAESGNFCVYGVGVKPEGLGFVFPGVNVTTEKPAGGPPGPGVTPAGTTLKLECTSGLEGVCVAQGLWAVTG